MFGFASAARAAQERTRTVTTPIACMVGFATIQQHVLARPAIDVAERPHCFPHFRIASRPAVGAEVAHVKKILGTDGSTGITQITLAHVGVPLTLEKDLVAALLFLSMQQAQEAPTGHLGGRLEPGRF